MRDLNTQILRDVAQITVNDLLQTGKEFSTQENRGGGIVALSLDVGVPCHRARARISSPPRLASTGSERAQVRKDGRIEELQCSI